VDGNDAVLRVDDTGAGIAPELLSHVFDAFRQGEGGVSRRHGGLGLGLTIVRQLARLHRGEVQVSSDGPGRGSTFVVRLPRDLPLRPADADGGAPPELRNVHALIVDDDPDARELMASMLEASGALTSTAASSEQALDLASAQHFDVLVSDIGLPGADGVALLQQLRSRGHTMPAIAISAFAAPADEQRMLAGGFQVYTPKPIQASDLVRTIASLVNVGGPTRSSQPDALDTSS
jgi:CheY-like chemotaxis protein